MRVDRDSPSAETRRTNWKTQVATWSVIVVGHIGLVALTSGFEWAGAIVYLEAGVLGLLLSQQLHRMALARDWYRHGLAPWLLRAVPSSFLVGGLLILGLRILNDLTSSFLLRLIGGYEEIQSFHEPSRLIGLTVYWSCIFLIWFFVRYGTEVRDRLRQSEVRRLQLEHAVTEERLRALRAQLDPHFVFNSLNGIRALITEDAERAREMISRLSDILRYTLGTTSVSSMAKTVPLRDEIATVRSYLELQAVRFEDRLRTTIDIAADAETASVPPMIVQHLVENAIKYGLARSRVELHILVTARIEGNRVTVEVVHPGRIVDPAHEDGGLHKSAERLRLIFGEQAEISLTQVEGDVVARLLVPVEGHLP